MSPNRVGAVLTTDEGEEHVPQQGPIRRTWVGEFTQATDLAKVTQRLQLAEAFACRQRPNGGQPANGTVVALRQLETKRRQFDLFPCELCFVTILISFRPAFLGY